MSWHEHAIFWQVYPLGFLGAEPVLAEDQAVTHRLPRLVDWLDYAVDLGVSGVLLGPVFTSSSHGYDTVDHFTIDPRLGDLDDFDALVAAAHARGLKVVLDGVFNHVGRDHPLVRAALGRPDAPEGGLFHVDLAGAGGADLRHVRGARGPGRARTTTTAAVAELVGEVMRYWLAGARTAGASTPRTPSRPPSGPRCCPASASSSRRCTWSGRSSTATTPRSSPSPGWTPSPSTSCGRRSGARSTTATSGSSTTPWAGTTPCSSPSPR